MPTHNLNCQVPRTHARVHTHKTYAYKCFTPRLENPRTTARNHISFFFEIHILAGQISSSCFMWIKTILVKQHRTFGSGQWLQQIASCSHYHSYKLPTSSRQPAQKALACTQLLLPLLNLRLICASKGCMPAPCQWPLAWWPLDHNTGPRKVYTVPRGLFLPFFSNIIKFLIVFMQACIICGSCSNQDAQVIDSRQNQT